MFHVKHYLDQTAMFHVEHSESRMHCFTWNMNVKIF